MKKVVLAYSGGLDTSCAVKWIRDRYGAQVICFSAFIGETKDKKSLVARAKSAGAAKVIIRDLKSEFAQDFLLPALWAHACYEGKYPLATALGRPLIAKHLVAVAQAEKADCVAHGCTGKGNDQVRIELGVRTLNPKLKVLAPLREWEFQSRDEEIEYAARHKIRIAATKKSPYSIDMNIWGVAIAAGICDGLGLGTNTKAALFTRGLVEMSRLGVKMGARAETFSGLSGMGDLVTTCLSPQSRNRTFGERIGRGEKMEEILKGTEMAVEGVRTAFSAVALGRHYGVDVPIMQRVKEILYDGKEPRQAVKELMQRPRGAEIRLIGA